MSTRVSWALALLAPLLVLAVRLEVDLRRELRAGDVALLGRAARLGSSEARARLAERGRQGDTTAWTELRGSILATRWLRTPDRPLLDEANTALAAATGVDRSVLERTHEPSRALSIVALAGLALFVLGVARALAGPARRHAVVGAVGFALFCIGLALA